MARVIDSLLIGLGFSTDKKSFQNAEGTIDSIKSKALQLGSVLAGAFGAKALTFDFAATNDELGKFAERWGVAANDVAAYDRALQHAGGSQGEFLGTVESLSKALRKADFEKAAIVGEAAQFGIGDQVSSVLEANDALEGFLRSADVLGKLTGTRREKFIEALGFSDSEVRLLSTGRDGILKAVQAEKQMAPVTAQMTATAAAFNDEWQDLTTNISGFANNVAEPLTAKVTSIVAGMNDWMDANRDLINSFIELGSDVVIDNLEAIVGILGIMTGAKIVGGIKAISSGLGKIGAGGAAKTVSKAGKLGGVGLAAGSAVIGADAIDNLLAENIPGYREADVAFTDFMKSLFSGNGSSAPTYDAYGTQPPAKIDIYLDGQVIDARIEQKQQEQNEQVIQDFKTSNGG